MIVLRRFPITVLLALSSIIGCDPASETSTQSADSYVASDSRPTPGEPSKESQQETETLLNTKPNAEQKPEADRDNPILTVSVSNVEAAATGTIAGTVIYRADSKRRWRYSRYYIKDSQKGHLAEAVVALRSIKLKRLAPASEPQESKIDQKDTRFTPETVTIRKGDRVKFTNSDSFLHNVHSSNLLSRFDDSINNGQSFTQTFTRAGGVRQPIVLGCRLHSVMQAWVFVFDHPWFQLTATDGRFRLENIPPGTYRLEMAHPAGDLEWSQQVEVKAGKTITKNIEVSPENLSN